MEMANAVWPLTIYENYTLYVNMFSHSAYRHNHSKRLTSDVKDKKEEKKYTMTITGEAYASRSMGKHNLRF